MKLKATLTEREYVISSIIKEDGKDVFVQQYKPKSIVDYQLAKRLIHMMGNKPISVKEAETRLKLKSIQDVHGINPTVQSIVEKHPLEFRIVTEGKKELVMHAR